MENMPFWPSRPLFSRLSIRRQWPDGLLRPLFCAVLLLVVLSPPVAAKPVEPQEIVKQTTQEVLEVLRKEGAALKKDRAGLHKIINELILPHFDFRRMSQWVLGRHWRQASEPQRVEFTKQFEQLLVRTYSDALVDFRDQSVSFLPTRERSKTDVAVRVKVSQRGGPSVPITYRMQDNGKGWKIYDVSIDGVSLVITYRSSFTQEIKRNGLDGLIRRLETKNRASRG